MQIKHRLTGVVLFKVPGANLTDANLTDADLAGADLTDADLTDADLTGANLPGANLTGTCLDPSAAIPPVLDYDLISAGFDLSDGRVYGWRTSKSMHVGEARYRSGERYEAPYFSISPSPCHPGIYMAGKAWLDRRYPCVLVVRCWTDRDQIHKAGDKFRARWIVVE